MQDSVQDTKCRRGGKKVRQAGGARRMVEEEAEGKEEEGQRQDTDQGLLVS